MVKLSQQSINRFIIQTTPANLYREATVTDEMDVNAGLSVYIDRHMPFQ